MVVWHWYPNSTAQIIYPESFSFECVTVEEASKVLTFKCFILMVLSKIQGVSGDSVKQKLGQSWASQVALVVKNLPASAGDLRCQRRGFVARVGKIPWRRTWQPTPVFLLENPMDRGVWRATVHGSQRVRQNWGTITFDFYEISISAVIHLVNELRILIKVQNRGLLKVLLVCKSVFVSYCCCNKWSQT